MRLKLGVVAVFALLPGLLRAQTATPTLIPTYTPRPNQVVSDLQLNSYTTGQQVIPDVAIAPGAGQFVVTWLDSSSGDGWGDGVFARRATTAGSAAGAEFQVSVATTGDQNFPHVATDPSGNFVAVWSSDEPTGGERGVFGRGFTSAGLATSAEFQINTWTAYQQNGPMIGGVTAPGAFTVIWQDNALDGSDEAIVGRRWLGANTPNGAQFQVNTFTAYRQITSSDDFSESGDIAFDSTGAFVVVWSSFPNQDGNSQGIFAQRYAATGAASGTEFLVNEVTFGSQGAARVASAAGRGFVVVWSDYANHDGDGSGVFGRRYASTGSPIGAQFQINTYTSDGQFAPDVAMENDGDFVVAWTTNQQDGAYGGIVGQRFSSAGSMAGGEFAVSSARSGSQTDVAVASDGQGVTVFAWGSALDSQDTDIKVAVFNFPTNTPTSTPTTAPTATPTVSNAVCLTSDYVKSTEAEEVLPISKSIVVDTEVNRYLAIATVTIYNENLDIVQVHIDLKTDGYPDEDLTVDVEPNRPPRTFQVWKTYTNMPLGSHEWTVAVTQSTTGFLKYGVSTCVSAFQIEPQITVIESVKEIYRDGASLTGDGTYCYYQQPTASSEPAVCGTYELCEPITQCVNLPNVNAKFFGHVDMPDNWTAGYVAFEISSGCPPSVTGDIYWDVVAACYHSGDDRFPPNWGTANTLTVHCANEPSVGTLVNSDRVPVMPGGTCDGNAELRFRFKNNPSTNILGTGITGVTIDYEP